MVSASKDPVGPTHLESQLRVPWWHKAAACRGRGFELVFLDRGRSSKATKAICAKCPVRGACFEWAVSQPELPYGIWGGLGRGELLAEKKRRALQVA